MSHEILKSLEGYGLTEKEARVYTALLPFKDVGSSKVIRSTGLHGQFVYDALGSLEQKGLVQHVLHNGRKKFSACSPKRLIHMIEERKLSALAVIRELEDRFTGTHDQSFAVYQGENAFVTHQLEMLREMPIGSVIQVIASQTEKYMRTFEELGMSEEYESLRKERKISIRYLGAEAQKERLSQMEKKRHLWTFRVLPGQSTGITSTEIHPDKVSFVVYGVQVLDFTLLSREVADGYREFFETLWNLSSK